MDPMLLPGTKTNSYHMYSKSALICPVEFLRWCWGAYLELRIDDDDDGCKNDDKKKESLKNEIDFHSLESYSTALDRCKWLKHKKYKKETNENNGNDKDCECHEKK